MWCVSGSGIGFPSAHRDRPVRPSSMLGSCCQSFAPRLSLGPVRLVALFRPSRFLVHSPCLGQSSVLLMMTVCFSENGIGLLTFAIHSVVMHVCSSGSGIGFPEELITCGVYLGVELQLWCVSGSGIGFPSGAHVTNRNSAGERNYSSPGSRIDFPRPWY